MLNTRQTSGAAIFLAASLLVNSPITAQELQVPVMEYAQDDLDTCAYGEVHGLRADGDGFLAVRSGPGTSYVKIDEVYNGDRIWMFDQRGKWLGIVYGTDEVICGPISSNRPVPHPGKKGWVHQNWIKMLAG